MAKNKSKEQNKDFKEAAREKICQGAKELNNILTAAKTKFDNADDGTKRKIVAGITGSIALIASAIGISKIRKNKKE